MQILYSKFQINYLLLIKYFKFVLLVLSILRYTYNIKNKQLSLNNDYLNIENRYNLKSVKNKIKLGIITICLKNGGRSRITSLLINYLSNYELFNIYLFTKKSKQKDEYKISNNSKRILINNFMIYNILKEVKKKKIDVLIYQLSNYTEINSINKLKNLNIIFYIHQSFWYWIYKNYFDFKYLYKYYQNSKYLINLIPLENNYLFKKWGIKSILND